MSGESIFFRSDPAFRLAQFLPGFRKPVKQNRMSTDRTNKGGNGNDTPRPSNIGNASNPSPQDDNSSSPEGSQLLNEKAEKYLREVASIEDVPDAQDQQEMEDAMKKDAEK
jgi:hypothetical protein